MKARIERERIPARQDPAFHLKLGKGSLSDVEWTVQLLQLRHGVRSAGTLDALHELHTARCARPGDDAEALRDAYRFCEHTRNRWHLVGALPGGVSPGDALPAAGPKLSRLARSLATTPSALREDYRRVTRRARRVVERVFYGLDPVGPTNAMGGNDAPRACRPQCGRVAVHCGLRRVVQGAQERLHPRPHVRRRSS